MSTDTGQEKEKVQSKNVKPMPPGWAEDSLRKAYQAAVVNFWSSAELDAASADHPAFN